jgi:hypothetical protein
MQEINPAAMKAETDKVIMQIPVKNRRHHYQGCQNTQIESRLPEPHPVMKNYIKSKSEPEKQRMIFTQECQPGKQTKKENMIRALFWRVFDNNHG